MKKLSVYLLTGILLFSSVLPASSVSASSENLSTKNRSMKVPMKESTSQNSLEMLSQEELSQATDLSDDSDKSNKKSPRNTVNDAITVQTDTVYSTTVPSDNSVWIKVNTAGKKKLTMVAQFNNSVHFITNIYELTDSTTLTRVQQSQNFMDKSDAISFIPNGGWYYIQIFYLSGDRNVNFLLETSNSASAREPNDNIYQATTYNDYINVVDTFDSYRDQDWSILNVTSPGTYYVATMFKTVYQGPVYVNIVNLETGDSYYIHQDTPIFGAYADLTKTGKYAICITSDKEVNPTNEYVLTVAKEDSAIAPDDVRLSLVHDQNGNTIANDVSTFNVKSGTTIQLSGYLTKNKRNLANVPIIVCLYGTGDRNTKIRTNFTDTTGYYVLDPNVPKSYGNNYWGNGQYFDLNTMTFYDFAGNQIGNKTWTLRNFT